MTMLRIFLAAIFSVPLVCCVTFAEKLPNIVLLYTDDMGYGDLSANNPESKIPTPRLDELVSQGMRFTDGHSSAANCSPSRYALLTGQFHWRKFHNIVHEFVSGSRLEENRLTLPAMLGKKGYDTVCHGKWHLGWNWDAVRTGPSHKPVSPEDFDWSKEIPDGPLDRGFNHYYGKEGGLYTWIKDSKVEVAPDTVLSNVDHPGPGVSNLGWAAQNVVPHVTDKTVEYILAQKDAERPFFLYRPFFSPHKPVAPAREFRGKSAAGGYGDYVYETDHACGRIIDAIKEIGAWENTIIIFTSDNGPENFAYRRDGKNDHWSAGKCRGLKRDLYEGGHRVPFIIRWPGLTKAGTVSDEMISQVDLMATFAALVGYELPADAAEDSHDFLPYLQGMTANGPRRSIVHGSPKARFAVRLDEWVLIDHHTGYDSNQASQAWLKRHGVLPDDGLDYELYNLAKDVGQINDLAADEPEVVKRLKAHLDLIREQGHSAPRLNHSDLD